MTSDSIAIVTLVTMFLYLVVYKKNKLTGNLGFIITGIAILSIDNTNTVQNVAGLIMTIGGIVSILYDIFSPTTNKTLARA